MNPEDVARFPLPGTASPIQLAFSPDDNILSYLHAEGGQLTRQLWGVDVNTMAKKQLGMPPHDGDTEENLSLKEKLKRERQRLHATGVTSFFWSSRGSANIRIMVPLQGNVYVQDGIDSSTLRIVYDKAAPGNGGVGAVDPQMSPDGRLVAFVKDGEIFVASVDPPAFSSTSPGACSSPAATPEAGTALPPPVQLTFGGRSRGVTHGLADFVAQEEMDRYRGFWWSLDSSSIAFTEVDERHIPSFRIMHQGKDTVGEGAQEDHHYPFAGKDNPKVRLAVVEVDAAAIQSGQANTSEENFRPTWMDIGGTANGGGTPSSGQPTEGQTSSEPASSNDNGGVGAAREGAGMEGEIYLARVNWLQDGSLCAQVQNRAQTELRLLRLDPRSGAPTTLVVEKSKIWVNLHHLLRSLPAPALQQQPRQEGGSSGVAGASDMDVSSPSSSSSSPAAPDGSFSFIWASERSGFMHLYLYQYVPGADKAVEIRQITSGEWVVEFVVGVDQANDVVYVMGTYDSPCERHLYAVPLNNPKGGPGGSAKPVRLTEAPCMHNVIMDHRLRRFVDVYSSPEQPAKMVLYALSTTGNPYDPPIPLQELHSALDDRVLALRHKLPPPEVISFETRDREANLFAAVYRPDVNVHGPGPYPTIVAVYGGPHVQWVSRSWGCTVDMRAQRLRDLGFLVLKCDNRGSFRRGLAFEAWVKWRMGGVEITDQEDCVHWAVKKGLADPARVGIYGWSYGGYATAMCLCKAPNTFRVGVSGAPVTAWDGYDTHYTERYMGTPMENPKGYTESSVLTHASKLEGKLMLVHGLMDENVHFRHTARLINALIAARKPYDLLIFPDERHSPRKLQDRVYMEQRISDYFVQHLVKDPPPQASHL
ncbi:putative dipeptidyl peptidase IV [Ectocarpus siliculosus]|uniref:Dipeptidyl peptidase IV n=1 Tax=Ectocarpus siliculosus TaxID=2880 RepID=D7FUX6_ECTSI|nr:putative dipeptidyl peptidase IV [Ectocarpus siliculosus]|eukprot:CBJ31782.1 putative dipeptidyl peptidase IV [Ectocarpus siliculosus]